MGVKMMIYEVKITCFSFPLNLLKSFDCEIEWKNEDILWIVIFAIHVLMCQRIHFVSMERIRINMYLKELIQLIVYS